MKNIEEKWLQPCQSTEITMTLKDLVREEDQAKFTLSCIIAQHVKFAYINVFLTTVFNLCNKEVYKFKKEG